jgi:hypothetical protein
MLGSPPTIRDAYVVARNEFWFPEHFGIFNIFLQNLYREDLFFANKQFTNWTTSLEGPNKGDFENFSQKFARLYPGYMLDKDMLIRPK